jgi:hypothetical protein
VHRAHRLLSESSIALVGALSLVAYGQSSPSSSATSTSESVLPRSFIVTLSVVKSFFSEIAQETSTGENLTAVGNPKATRSVIYTNSDGWRKVTITVDQYASSSDASSAYQEAVQKSKTVPGFKPISAPNLGRHASIGTVTQGAETHIGLGALDGTLFVAATLAGYEPTPGNVAKLIELTRTEQETAKTALDTSASPAAKDTIDALIQSQVTDGNTPGIAISIAKDGRTIYEKAAGVRDTSTKAPMLITTPQSIGSTTKQFTAAAILLLQQEKKLSIDDKLSKHVPEYVHGDKITLRQMLNMGSGISDDDPAIYGGKLTQPITREAMFKNLNKLPLMWKPGTHIIYTNTNYNLLALSLNALLVSLT